MKKKKRKKIRKYILKCACSIRKVFVYAIYIEKKLNLVSLQIIFPKFCKCMQAYRMCHNQEYLLPCIKTQPELKNQPPKGTSSSSSNKKPAVPVPSLGCDSNTTTCQCNATQCPNNNNGRITRNYKRRTCWKSIFNYFTVIRYKYLMVSGFAKSFTLVAPSPSTSPPPPLKCILNISLLLLLLQHVPLAYSHNCHHHHPKAHEVSSIGFVTFPCLSILCKIAWIPRILRNNYFLHKLLGIN